MGIPSQGDIETMRREALQMLRNGDLFGAINQQTELVERLLVLGPKAVKTNGLTEALEEASSSLVDSLRWAGMYGPAIGLHLRLVDFLPALTDSLNLGAANLRVESGEMEADGLLQLREMVAAAPDNFWYRVSLASALMYMEQFEEAEQVLREAADMAHVRKVDRALVQEHLFGLYNRQGKTDEALLAWREAGRLDHNLRGEMLPEVCRMLIYWRKFPEARKHIALDKVQVRKQFYLGLAEFVEGKSPVAAQTWQGILQDFDPVTLEDGQDEFAETCLRMGAASSTIMALEKLVEAGQTSFYRSVILGLAYAQRGLLNRAKFYLDIAMRLGDMERPRQTLPTVEKRVLGMLAGILYSGTPLDPAVRKEIEGYFVPKA
jgi:tetratricopeptide (TPR) repeat protein